jgi:hypothetical protein
MGHQVDAGAKHLKLYSCLAGFLSDFRAHVLHRAFAVDAGMLERGNSSSRG